MEGYGWIDKLKEVVAADVTDRKCNISFPLQTPASKEEYHYRSYFHGYFK
jgi:asparagine synthase (glutamine-hydrolysing)